jgi:protease IV
MKTHSAILIGCGSIIVILVAAFLVGFCVGLSPAKDKIASDSWLVVDPSGYIPDYSEIRGSDFMGFSMLSVDDICRRIRQAADDEKIQGIVLKPVVARISYANLNEIASALQDFKATNKPVIAHGVVLAQQDYLLCSMADEIYMDPTASGGLILEGVSANVLFYSEALKKLGIKMHVMQSGDYKGAGEPYTQTELSPGTEENLRKVLKSRYDLLRADIARFRDLDSSLVTDVYENRPDLIINAQQAIDYGLIDETLTWEDLKSQKGLTENNCRSVNNYKGSDKVPLMGTKIAVVNLSGSIMPSQGFTANPFISASKVDDILDAIEKDTGVKAVVLRVNSPGGSATESELIYQRINKMQIPVVVSMGGMAASGGYYISCAGDHIIADPHTITGSIGVVMVLPEAEELGNKLGIDSQTLSYGTYADFGSIFEKQDEKLLESLKRNSESVYAEFRQRVMEARNIGPDEIDAVSEGRVFSAADAQALKLVDEVGGLEMAVEKAASLAGITGYSVKQYPEKINFWELFKDQDFFQIASDLISHQQKLPDERLTEYIEKTLATGQWLYFCPHGID